MAPSPSPPAAPRGGVRIALGVGYRGGAYRGWQSQPDGVTVQDRLEDALARFADRPRAGLRTVCAGRTDAGVHAVNQVVHLDSDVERESFSWVRGTNRFLPPDIAVQWARPVAGDFHARNAALGRRYRYLLLESPVRPGLDSGLVGWSHRPLDAARLRTAADVLVGEHDFSAFRSSECQAASPVKTLRSIDIGRRGAYWRLDFDADAFLHHMVRNLVGSLVVVAGGQRSAAWLADVLASRERERAAPTFAAAGLYFLGPYYPARHAIPEAVAASEWPA